MTLKRKCMVSFTALSLLMMLLTFSAFVSVQASEPTSGDNIPPDMPENALQFNRTDITPAGYMETIQAMEMNVFFYRNVTLMMNCTRNCEMNVTIDPQVRNRIVSVSVEPNQTMLLNMNISASPPQGETVMERTLNFYMGLEPNATLQLQSQLRLLINQTELSAELNREVNASRLTWMYWNRTQAQWVPVESYMDQNGYLVCNTTHFSTWTVAETESPDEVPENIHVYTVIGLIVTITAATALWKRKKLYNHNQNPS
ncbi:MAG: hypothetical protein OEY81_08045 [Candidatus Bathyarchaeota archaeon]|nr:hypothetical protein [Candidatus Bathyarchaeota archaeon]